MEGARGRGLAYEGKVQRYLEQKYPESYVYAPWIRFEERGKHVERWCQPDALLIDLWSGQVTIVEIKLKHTVQAWYQLFQLYVPVVKEIFGDGFSYACCEIVRWYDAAIQCPQEVALIPHDVTAVLPGDFGVFVHYA